MSLTLAATPASLSVTAGGAAQTFTLTASELSAQGTASDPVPAAVSISGLPSGVTATPATMTLMPGIAQTVALTASSSAASAKVNVTATSTAGSLKASSTIGLRVTAVSTPPPPPPAPDFSLALAPTTATLTTGSSSGASFVINAAPLNGFTGPISVAFTNLGPAITTTPASLTLTPGTPQSVTLAAGTTAIAGTSTVTVTGTAGSLVHSATLALTVLPVPAQPDFALSLAPAAATITIGNTTGASVALSLSALAGFTGSVSVAESGLPAGVTANPASFTLSAGTSQNIAFTASSTAAAGAATLTFTATSGALKHGATLVLTVQPAPVPDVTTYHYDNTRQGVNAQETILTPANVNTLSFGKTGFYPTDGKVDAQPLFAANVPLAGGGKDNLVYVASEHGSLYAFSATAGQQVWRQTVLGANETPSDDHGCGQITPEIGITATPVIDRSTGNHGAVYLVAMSKDSSGAYHQRLHALDLSTGTELSGSPTEIAATYPGTGDSSSNGVVTFEPGQYAERAGLLLTNGTLYLGWTSHCDQRPYTGWVMGYSETTLQQVQVLNLTPNGNEGSIWMAGYGMAADAAGNIYFLDANGSFSGNFNPAGFPADGDYGNAMIKLSTTNGTLDVSDYFQPYDTIYESSIDEDLGSGGAMLLPDLTDASGTVHHLIVGAGKDDNIYVGNRDNLGKFNQAGGNNSNLYQEVVGGLRQGAWSGPAYFNNTVYYAGQGDVLKAFPIANALLASTPASVSAVTFQYPGTTPTVSANGVANGIVWAVEDNTGAPAVLHAYDATNVANELYNSNQAAAGRDSFGPGNKFITPMEVNGNVYVGTPTGVAVFGLLP